MYILYMLWEILENKIKTKINKVVYIEKYINIGLRVYLYT